MVSSEKVPVPDRTHVKRWAKIRLRAGYVYIALALIFASPQLAWTVVGLVLILSGIAIRLIASATLVKDKVLCVDGIYALTRNPLYLGSALIGLGFAMLAALDWLLGVYVLILVPVYIRMIFIEERFLSQLHPAEFEQYRKAVPRFFPSFEIRKIRDTLNHERLVRSKELISALLFLVIAALILLIHRTWIPA